MSDKSLKNIRNKIDKVDQDIYKLIQKRASHAVAIGKIKSKISPKSSFYKPDREAKVLRNILKSNEKGLLPDAKIRSIYKELISGCLSLEEILKVAYLGPEGTHSEAAVYNQFGSQIIRIPTLTIDDVFFQVVHDEVNIGVVPVENSSEGVINTTLNCLADSENINIIGEISLDIDHQLASGNKFNINEAFAIASHPQALGQCTKWIEKNLGNIKRLEMPSSAVAAKYAANNQENVSFIGYQVPLIDSANVPLLSIVKVPLYGDLLSRALLVPGVLERIEEYEDLMSKKLIDHYIGQFKVKGTENFFKKFFLGNAMGNRLKDHKIIGNNFIPSYFAYAEDDTEIDSQLVEEAIKNYNNPIVKKYSGGHFFSTGIERKVAQEFINNIQK